MHLEKLLQLHVIVDITGLSITIIGALISASGAIVEEPHAKKIARTEGSHNHELEEVIKDQSRSAKHGLILIAIGTSLQIVAAILQVIL